MLIIPTRELCLKGRRKMITSEQEIELLMNILVTISDDQEYANVAKRIIELNSHLEYRAKREQSDGLKLKLPYEFV